MAPAATPSHQRPSDPSLLTLYTSNRLDVLVRRLVERWAAEPLPPLEREIVVVQSEGMQRWLTLELARRHGIAGSLTTPFPRPFCQWLARRVLGDASEALPLNLPIPRADDSFFGRERLAWRLFARLGPSGDAADLGPPSAYLADDSDQRKRYQLAQRLGSLFDDYQMFRGDLLASWESESAVSIGGQTETWQRALWRWLVASAPTGEAPFWRRLRDLTETLAWAGAAPAGLPRRVQVLGVSTLPPAFVALLAALARFVPVDVCFVSPTHHYWGDLKSDREQVRIARRMRGTESAAGPQHLERGNPLLAALGKQGREFFNELQKADPEGQAWHDLDFLDPIEGDGAPTVLSVLQSDVLDLRDRGGAEGPPPLRLGVDTAADDVSLEVHACHAPMREMEVLHDRLLDAFDRDPDLRPSDVLVLVPDIELYGPYIQAVFGGAGRSRARDAALSTPPIPFSIADRRAGREQPPSETILEVLELVTARVTVRQVFDLLETPAVRRSFGLSAAELPDLRRLVAATRVRWGLDAAHRARAFEVPAERQNTWRAGLDRLLLGYATGGVESLVDDVLPFAGDTAGPVESLGRFADFVDVLFAVLDGLRRPRSLADWAAALTRAVDRLFLAEDDLEEQGLQLVRTAADQLRQAGTWIEAVEMPGESGDVEAVPLEVVREHLDGRLSEEGFGSGFLAGKVTFCALRPMRTIPFKVIAIAGLDDGAFPRRDRRPRFDLMAREPRPGDRSLRDDDRYLFLETLLAAGERLILSFVGFSQRDAARKEPSLVVTELLDQVDRSFVAVGRDGAAIPARRLVVVEHPLQPWSPRYFQPQDGAGRDPRLFSFSHAHRDAAARLAAARREGAPAPPPFVEAPLDASAEHVLEITVDELVEFWRHPIRHFCRRTLGFDLEGQGATDWQADWDAEPFGVDPLDGYQLRQWLVARRLAGGPVDRDLEWRLVAAQGILPAGSLGLAAWRRIRRRVDAFVERLSEQVRVAGVDGLPRTAPRSVDVEGEGWRLTGRVDGWTESAEGAAGGGLLRFRCAALRPADRLRTWIEHLAVSAAEESGSAGSGARVVAEDLTLRFGAVSGALQQLDRLVDGLRQGRRRPLPLLEATSWAWAHHAASLRDPRSRSTRTPRDVARDVFLGRARSVRATASADALEGPGPEAEDPYVRLCFRGADLLDHPEVERWAERLWRPVLEHGRES